jgi:hypothetical protein
LLSFEPAAALASFSFESKAFTRLRRASHSRSKGFRSPSESESLSEQGLSLAFGERVTLGARAFARLRRASHSRSKAFTRLWRASHSWSKAFTRLWRASHSWSGSFHSPSASESLSLESPRESNQREGDPGIRAGRTSSVLFPAVLVAHRPANNSAIPGLRQFAFPRWPPPLLGATAGTEDQRHACGVEQRNRSFEGRRDRNCVPTPSSRRMPEAIFNSRRLVIPLGASMRAPNNSRDILSDALGEGALSSFGTSGRTVSLRAAFLGAAGVLLTSGPLQKRRGAELGTGERRTV